MIFKIDLSRFGFSKPLLFSTRAGKPSVYPMGARQLKGLVDKVENSAVGSRDLDSYVVELLYGGDLDMLGCVRRGTFNPTTSLTDAMTLVPTRDFRNLRSGSWWWMLESREDEKEAHIAYENGDSGIPEYSSTANTEALALTSASLKAHAELFEDWQQ